jgi:phytoene synthase
VTTALNLYGGILDRIEELDFAVFTQRARVGKARRLQVAAPAFARALWARRGHRATMDVMRTINVPGAVDATKAEGTS